MPRPIDNQQLVFAPSWLIGLGVFPPFNPFVRRVQMSGPDAQRTNGLGRSRWGEGARE